MIDYVYWIRGAEHRAMCELSIASARKVDKRGAFYVYSDDPDLEPIKGVNWSRMKPGRPAMVANLDAQVTHLSTATYGNKILFLDADVLVKRIFPFGLASLYPTWRDHVAVKDGEKIGGIAKLMPYNYGVLGALADRWTVEAFLWMRHRILHMSDQHQSWYGNQFALYELCGDPKSERKVAIPWAMGDYEPKLEVERLPCETWNYVPEGPGEDVEGKGMLHFKGGRKDLMEHYA